MRKKILFKHSGYFDLVTYNVAERSLLFEAEKAIGKRLEPDGILYNHVTFKDIVYMEAPRYVHKLSLRVCDQQDWNYILQRLPHSIIAKDPIAKYSLYKMMNGNKPHYFLCGSFVVEEKTWML